MRRDTRTSLLTGVVLTSMILLGGYTLKSFESSPIDGPAVVVDGDSLMVKGLPVRLLGIDAPEWGQTCLDTEGKVYACGMRSRNRLLEFIGGSIVSCTLTKRDMYNRFLGYCRVRGADIAQHMVASGNAITYGDQGWRYQEVESAARNSRLGIWAGYFDEPRIWRAKSGK